ncbi:hypothetical protein ACXHXM_25970
MTFTAKYNEDGSIVAGPLSDGNTWNSITPASRFYDEVMTLTNGGQDILQYVERAAPISAISRRQFFQQAAVGGIITENEALAAVTTGALPASVIAFISTLPAEQQFGAKMLFSVNEFERSSALANAFGTAIGMTPEQIDDFFTAAAAL